MTRKHLLSLAALVLAFTFIPPGVHAATDLPHTHTISVAGPTRMADQSGSVGPINYIQDNSGVDTDTTTQIEYTPQQFGAPATAKIIAGTVHQERSVSRGLAYIQNLSITDNSITFQVYTQAANNTWIFGWHSGRISIDTTFQWESQ